MERKFRDDFGVYCCPHVFRNERPILLVIRDEGDWQFLCGEADDFDDRPRLVEVGHLIERDNTLESAANLENGMGARRTSAKSKWEYFDLE